MSELREKLLYKSQNGYKDLSAEETEAMNKYCEEYKHFLDAGKTERECVVTAIYLAETHGFKAFDENASYKPGDKIYYVNRDKEIYLAVMGKMPLSCGIQMALAHTDSPRLDLKPQPLYEDGEMAWMKTRHYGYPRLYQWLNVPLSIHGVVVLADGSTVIVKVGEDPRDPQFLVADLQPHLAKEQEKRPLGQAIPSESMNLLVGGRPCKDEEGAELVKLEILRLLYENYGICEEDFISAELEAVPAAMARDLGFDRSFIGSYGHDDRVCAFAGLKAILEIETPNKTALCAFFDKEEIGSEGVTGTKGAAMDRFLDKLCKMQGAELQDCYANSFCLSADVTGAYDPHFAKCFDKHNMSRCNYGIAIKKYTGAGGKSYVSDASAELMGYLRNLLNANGVLWQAGEMGSNDEGNGGTLTKFIAERNIDAIDAGVPLLSMHAPCEIAAKLDCYMTYKAIKAVFEA